jgi:hypothetical protein
MNYVFEPERRVAVPVAGSDIANARPIPPPEAGRSGTLCGASQG